MEKVERSLARYPVIKKRFGEQLFALFLVAMPFVLSVYPDPIRAQTPGQSIGINPEYASPTKETPPGVEVNSASLVENANAWNGRVITFTGEAIGEAMIRGKMAWIHLNDDPYMHKNLEEGGKFEGYNSGHAVWASADQARKIYFFGDYKHAGDLIKVTGTFNATCREHGGDMDIHASSLEVIKTGRYVEHRTNKRRVFVAIGLFILAGILYGSRRLAERRRI